MLYIAGMKIKDTSVENLHLKGIYSITSDKGKRYIGSTKKSFQGRFKTHFEKLRSSNHMNEHLQSSWNKNGSNYFVFEILEILIDNFEEREGYWIEFYESWDRLKGYNIIRNPMIAPSQDETVRKRISNTLKRKYKSGEIKLNKSNWKPGTPPWNKGKKYKSTDHLKGVKKGSGRRCKDNQEEHVLDKLEELLETPNGTISSLALDTSKEGSETTGEV